MRKQMEKDKLTWNKYYYSNRIRERWFYPHYVPFCLKVFDYNPVYKYYAGKRVMSLQETNDYIYNLLLEKNPIMVGRFGQNELNFIIQNLEYRNGHYNEVEFEKGLEAMVGAPGFFPKDRQLGERFVELMLDSCIELDVIGMWHLFMEDYVIKKYCKDDIAISHLNRLEPWWGQKNPWTRALEGKKILVIHPFEESIKEQYSKNRKFLFENKDILPDFELYTIKAVQGMGCETEFKDWFEALDYMYQKAIKINFDVAIIGCGAYGFPLAALLKKAGKKAIHLGGVTQVLFGIKGKRFEEQGYKMNDYWVRPREDERPIEAYKADDSAYW